MIAQGDALLLMGAVLVGTATFLLARAASEAKRRQLLAAKSVSRRSRGEMAIAFVGLGLGLVVIALGLVTASPPDGINPVALVAAGIAVGAAAALPGVLIMVSGWRRFAQWAERRSSPNPPFVWLLGATLSLIAFTMFAVFFPVVYFILAT